ncbi:MAG: 8-oxo-dGTP diphosphatase [Bulleidia sp.]|nr:8-oxo-dGTP diphosphatase [Bulleidia sp.]
MQESSCVYLINDGKWLLLYRNVKANDVNHGKWIGVGGKKEAGETMEQCARREFLEETGLTLLNLRACGLVYFHYEHADEVITVYASSAYEGEMHACDEGTLAWIEEDKVMDLPMWEGDRIFLAKLMKRDAESFILDLYYDTDGNLIRHEERNPL